MSFKSVPDQYLPFSFQRLVHKSAPFAIRALGALCLGSFIAAAQPPQVAPAITTRQAGKLELHHPVERDLGPGQADLFTVDATAGQFLHVVAEQKGVDVVVSIIDTDGKVLVTADRQNGTFAPEAASAIAPQAGSTQVKVEKNSRSSETGRYVVELTDLRNPTSQDRLRIQAEAKLFQGTAEQRAGDAASREKALQDFSEAASLFGEVQDGYEQGLCLGGLAVMYAGSGDRQKALGYYEQALEVRRKAGDRAGEATTLANMSRLYSEPGDRQKALDLLNEALAIRRSLGDRLTEAGLLESVASLYSSAGEKEKALESYNQALGLCRALGNRGGEASVLRNIGELYQALGERQKAIDSYVQSLAVSRAMGDSNNVDFTTFIHLGELFRLPKAQPILPGRAATGSAPDELPVHLVAQVGHPSGASAIAFSADGRFILTANGSERSATLWSASDGKEIRTFEGHTAEVACVAFLPGGAGVVTGSQDKTIRIWDLRTGRELQRMQDSITISSIAVSPGGDLIATASDGIYTLGTLGGAGPIKTAHLWDRRTGAEIRPFEGHTDSIRAVAFSPDGNWLATGSADHTARLWEVATGKEIRSFTRHDSAVNSVAFSADGKMLATASGPSSMADLLRLAQIQMNRDVPPSERMNRAYDAAIAGEHTIRLWSLDSGEEIRTIDAPAAVLAVAFSPDGRYLASGGGLGRYSAESGCKGCEAHLWDVVSGKEAGPVSKTTPNPMHMPVTVVAFSPDGKLLASKLDSDVVVLQTNSGAEVSHLKGYASVATALAIAPDGRYTVTGALGATPVWDHQTGRPRPIFSGLHVGGAMDFSPGGAILAVGAAAPSGPDSQIGFWDLRTDSEARRFSRPGRINSLRFSPDGRLLLVRATGQPPCVVEASTGDEVRCFKGIADTVVEAFFSPAGDAVITVSRTTGSGLPVPTVMVWDVKTGAELRSFKVFAPLAITAAVSPVGETIVVSGLSSLVYNWRTGELVRELFTSTGMSGGRVSFSPDGRWLAVGSLLDTSIWDVSSGQERWEAPAVGSATDLKFSPDGRFVFRSGSSGLTYVWDFATGKQVCSLVSFTDGSWAVTDPDGRYDASNPDEAIGLHWVAGTEVIELGQLKQRFYTPGLFARVLKGEQLPDVASIQTIKLFPRLEVQPPAPGSTRLNVKLTNRGGGIGRVVVKVNGKEIASDARGAGLDPEAPAAQFPVDLAGAAHAADGRNLVEVFAYDGRNLLSSRGVKVEWKTEVTAPAKLPRLFAVIAGVSEYDNPALNLRYAAKDAESMAQALRLAGEGLLGKGRVSIHLLSTSGVPGSVLPSKDAFIDAFQSIINEAEDQDILVVYLAGHGVALRGAEDDYYFLTRAARSSEVPVNDLKMMNLASVSSEDLRRWCLLIKARKEVIILDTCAAGAAREELNKLGNRRDLSADQTRAIEMLKDRIGAHILMGSASDAVSYETTSYGQGLLTYALLQGMKGAALEDGDRVDVVKLFSFASTRVVELARGIGGIQQPQVSSPGGQSFYIGLLSDAAKLAIPLASQKPQLMRVRCTDDQDSDPLGLGQRVRARLRDATQPVTRGNPGSEPPVAYSDDELDIASAMSPRVRYHVQGEKLEATVRLFRNEKQISTDTLTMNADPAAAAQQIADAIIKAAAKAGGQ